MVPKRRIVYSEASEVINPVPSNGNKADMPEKDEHTTSQANGKALYSLGISSPVPVTPTASVGPADDGRTGAILASGVTEEGKDGFCAFTLATTVPNASAARSASPCRPWSQTPPPPPQQTDGIDDDGDDDDEGPVVLPKRRNNNNSRAYVKPVTDLSSATKRKPTLGQLKDFSSGNTLAKDETSSSPPTRVLSSEINVVRVEDSHHDKVITSFMGRSPTPLGTPTIYPPTAGLGGVTNLTTTTTTTSADLYTSEGSAPVFSPAINVGDNTEAYAFRSTTSDVASTIRRAMTSLTVHRGEAGSADVDHNASPTSPAQNRSDIVVVTVETVDASSAATASSSTHRGNANTTTTTTNNSTNSTGTKGYSTLSSSSATSAAYSRYPQPTVANRSSSLPDGALPAVQTVFLGVTSTAFSFSSPSPVPNSGGQQFSPPPPLATASRAVGVTQQQQQQFAELSTTRRSRSPERGQQGQFSSGAQIVCDRPPSSSPANNGPLPSDHNNSTINNNNANTSGLVSRSPAASVAAAAATTTTTGWRLAFFASPSPPPTPAIIRDIEDHVKKVLQGPPNSSAVDGLADATKGTGQGQKRKSSTHDRRSLSPSRPNADFQDNKGGAGASSSSPGLPETTSRTPPPTRRSASPSRIDRVVHGLGGSLTRGDGPTTVAVTCPEEAGLRNALEFGMMASPLAAHSGTQPALSSSPNRVRMSTAVVAIPSASSPLHVCNEASLLSARPDVADPSTQSALFLEPSPPPLVSSASISGGVIAAVARGPTIIASREEEDEDDYFEDGGEITAVTSGGIAGDGDDGTATTRRKKKASVFASPSPAPAPVRPQLRATLSRSDGGNKTTGLTRGSTTTAGAAAVSRRANTTATSLGGSSDYTSTTADESTNYFGNVLDADGSGGKSPDVSERFLSRPAYRRGDGSRTQGTSVTTAVQDRPMLADLEDTMAALHGANNVGKGAVCADEENDDNTIEGEENGAILLHEVSREPLGKKALKRAQRMQNKELAKAKYKAATANTIPAVVRGGGDRANQKPLTGGKGSIGSGIASFFNNVLVSKERAAIEKRFMDDIMSEESNGRFYEMEKEQCGTRTDDNNNTNNKGRCDSEEDTHRVGFRDRLALYFISRPFLLWLASTRKGLILMLGLQTLLIMCLHGIATEVFAALY